MNRKIEILRYVCIECGEEFELDQLNVIEVNEKLIEYQCPRCGLPSFNIIQKRRC